MLLALKSNISKLICVDKEKTCRILFYLVGFSSLLVSVSGCNPAWSAPATNLTPEFAGAPFLYETCPSFTTEDRFFSITPFRRVYKQGINYGFRLLILGDGIFEESDNTILSFVNAIDAFKDEKIANKAVLSNSWVCVQGQNGVLEFSLLNKEFNFKSLSIKDVDEVAKMLHLAIKAMDEMKQLPPTVQP
jgi:hypothetical protein